MLCDMHESSSHKVVTDLWTLTSQGFRLQGDKQTCVSLSHVLQCVSRPQRQGELFLFKTQTTNPQNIIMQI